MKVRADQLKAHVSKPLQPIYIVSGDTPLLVQEATDAIRQAARKQGFTERELLHQEAGFDWNYVLESAASLSLFGDKKILELRLGSQKPNDAGKKVLVEYAGNPSPDTLLLVITDKLDSSVQRAKWFKSLEAAAVWIQIWPVDAKQLPQWIQRRMLDAGLKPDPDATSLIAERVEGNLLAAAQEIEKLRLLFGETTISAAMVQEAVADSARFDIFSLVDTALQGQTEKALRMLNGLKAEGTDATVVLWALSREIRSLASMRQQTEKGIPVGKVMQEYRVWANRKVAIQSALQKIPLKVLQQLLQQASQIDLAIKGSGKFSPWDGLNVILLRLSGARVPPSLLALPR